jgi:glycosyltransferase involved in cell wall biosynthesis
VYERATVCAVATPWAARSVIEDYEIPSEKVYVAWIGANHRVTPPKEKDLTRPRFLFVGREWERKNGPMVVRAFERLRAEVPAARLDVVGRHPLLKARGVTGHGLLRLERADERARIERLYQAATCFVMPSHREPAGIAFAEAMHAGLPCIGTSVGGASDLIGEAGCTVHPDNEDELVEAMSAYSDPDVARSISCVARDRSTMFTWEAVGVRLLNALRAVEPQPGKS